MSRGEFHVAHDVVGLEFATRYSAASSSLGLERTSRYGLDVLGLRHHNDEFFVVD